MALIAAGAFSHGGIYMVKNYLQSRTHGPHEEPGPDYFSIALSAGDVLPRENRESTLTYNERHHKSSGNHDGVASYVLVIYWQIIDVAIIDQTVQKAL